MFNMFHQVTCNVRRCCSSSTGHRLQSAWHPAWNESRSLPFCETVYARIASYRVPWHRMSVSVQYLIAALASVSRCSLFISIWQTWIPNNQSSGGSVP